MKLVKETQRQKSLSKEQTKFLLDMVKSSEKVDQSMYDNNRRMVDLLEGKKAFASEKMNAGRGSINLVHAQLRSMLPSLYFKEPTVAAYARHPSAAGKEEVWNKVLNATIRRNGFKKQVKEAVFDALLMREGWLKIGITVPEEDSYVATSEMKRGPTPWGSKSMPIVSRLSPNVVIVDQMASARDLESARFVAIRYKRHIDELRADPRYNIPKSVAKRTLSPIGSYNVMAKRNQDDQAANQPNSGYANIPKLVDFYEVWVNQLIENDSGGLKLYKQMICVSDISDEPLRMETWENVIGKEFQGWPFCRLVFNPVPDRYPIAEVEAWDNLQANINWAFNKILGFINNMSVRIGLDVSAVNDADAAKKQLSSTNDFEVIETKDVDKGKTPWFRDQGQSVPRDLYAILDTMISLVERVSQFSQNRLGAEANFRTATEAAGVAQASNVRDSERVDLVSDFLKDAVEKIANLIMQFSDTDIIFRLAGDVGTVEWQTFSPEDIAWMPDIEIEVDSFREMEPTQEATKYLQIIQISLQLFPVLGPVVDFQSILMDFFKAVKLPNPEKYLRDVAGEEQYQMLEIMLMMQGQPTEAAPTDPHQTHLKAIETLQASPVYQTLQPQVRLEIERHQQQHEQFLQQIQEQQQGQPSPLGNNPIDEIGANTPANNARRSTAFAREATNVQAGSGGQLG